jgi:Pentapeptide repeats (8 copies)
MREPRSHNGGRLLVPFVVGLLFQLPVSFDPSWCPHPYYWRATYGGPCKSRKDLDEIVAAHNQWIQSNGAAGKRADLHGAVLSNDDLTSANLWGANFFGAFLIGADFQGAILGPAGQNQQATQPAPGSWVLAPPTIFAVTVDADGETISTPPQTDLRHSFADNADFHGADLSYSRLDFADLSGADLSAANLSDSSLKHAYLVGTKLDHANVAGADFSEAVIEPGSVDGLAGLGSAKHLDTATFNASASGLIQLRKILGDQGFREQQREITYAINRKQASLDPRAERWFKRVAFDATCQYGMSPGRPLRLIFALWVAFSVFFYFAIHKAGWMRLRVSARMGYKEKIRETAMWSRPGAAVPGRQALFRRLRFEWRAIRGSLFFSSVNAFSIGYRDFSIGRWLSLLSPRQYEIRPYSWARSVAAAQSLLTVYLFALWLLTYFGQPFQ